MQGLTPLHPKRPGHVPGRVVLGALLALLLGGPARADDAALLRVLSAPGGVALMRHARAPGTGDPAGFRLGDCATQRNLDGAGRAQARRVGTKLREAGLHVAAVLASPWCRTTETAELLGLGPVTAEPALASFFSSGNAALQTAALRALLVAGRDGGPRVMVTHQVNITALTGIFPTDGEVIVLSPEPGGYAVAGRITPPPP